MLQYLTNDLLPDYGLPKKRLSITYDKSKDWVLRDTGVYLNGSIGWYTDINAVAIRINNRGLISTLHTDGTICFVFTGKKPLDWKDLHYYLSDSLQCD
jgi:hypothetical protein